MTTKEKEIHTTEFVDKKIPTIYVKKEVATSLTEGSNTVIEVSDRTSKAALITFEKVKKMVGLE